MTCWFDLEPSRGVWQFDRLDALVAKGERQNEQVILTLGQTPAWASTRPTEASPYAPGAAAEPISEQDWIDYVTKVVQRYRGRVKYYEIWNEPNLTTFWTGTPDRLLQMQRDAYAVIRAEDPAAKVISPSITADYGIPYFQQMLKGGMANYADVIGYHLYVLGYPPEQMNELADQVNESLAEANVSGKEIWNTETGWSLPNSFPDPTIAAAWVARAHLLAFSKGISRFIWYAWDSENWVTLQMTNAQYVPTPAASAYSFVQTWLNGAELTPCTEDGKQVWTCALVQGDKKGIIFWHPGGAVTINLPANLKAASMQDALGNQTPYSGSTAQADDLPRLVME
jgi:hypothetical protein